MKCPDAIAEVLLEIMYRAILQIRQSGDAAFCERTADHIHNLPRLISNYSREGLDHYWEIMRPYYMRKAPQDAEYYTGLWQRLTNVVGDLATDEQIALKEQHSKAEYLARRLKLNDPD